jgi:hypothetical protein
MTKTYTCEKHGFESTGLAAVQLHMNGNHGCNLGIKRDVPTPVQPDTITATTPSTTEEPTRCKAITFAGQPEHLLVRCSLPAEPHHANHVPSWSEADSNH